MSPSSPPSQLSPHHSQALSCARPSHRLKDRDGEHDHQILHQHHHRNQHGFREDLNTDNPLEHMLEHFVQVTPLPARCFSGICLRMSPRLFVDGRHSQRACRCGVLDCISTADLPAGVALASNTIEVPAAFPVT